MTPLLEAKGSMRKNMGESLRTRGGGWLQKNSIHQTPQDKSMNVPRL